MNENLLKIIANEISVDDKKYEAATNRYKNLTEWITREKSRIRLLDPNVYVHGSFALGTAINPLKSSDNDYDLDIFCRLDSESTKTISQSELKRVVGDEIKDYAKQYGMSVPEDNTRSWTINYSESSHFHMDVIPAIPKYSDVKNTNSFIPYKKSAFYNVLMTHWDKQSNPKGYLEWFKDQMKEEFNERRRVLAINESVTIEKVPYYRVRTVLQGIVILLKRHRDVYFDRCTDPYIKDHSVSSIIISTLAGLCYNKQRNLADAFIYVIENLENGMDEKANTGLIKFVVNESYNIGNKQYRIQNPANTEENFADKWNEKPNKKVAFFEWLKQLKVDGKALKNLLLSKTSKLDILSKMFGDDIIKSVANQINDDIRNNEQNYIEPINASERALSAYYVRIKAYCSSRSLDNIYDYDLSQYSIKSDERLNRGKHLLFVVDTNVVEPFDIYWQISNKGVPAILEDCLRGEIENGTKRVNGYKSRYQKSECTIYIGRHWIRCIIKKYGQTVAVSEKFYVNIVG